MDKKMNLIVKVNINDTTSNVISTSVNTVAILCESTLTDEAKLVHGSDEKIAIPDAESKSIEEFFGVEVFAMVEAYFGQSNNNGALMIVPVSADANSAAITAALNDALQSYDFYHVCVSKNLSTQANGKALQTWAAENFKMAHLISTDFGTGKTLCDVLNASNSDRVSVFYSVDYLNVAITSARCGLDPARGTWAHKTLQVVEYTSLTKSDMVGATDVGVNVYTQIAGSSRVFFGTVANKSFIDSMLKKDWLKFRIEERMFALLAEANSGYGLNLSDDGILALGAVISNVFTEASRNDKEYIMNNFSVALPQFSELSADNKAKRNVDGIKAYCTLMDSVHTVLNVEVVISR